MRVLDLFSGIGGFSLGLELASPRFKTIAFCEYDKDCREVLELRWPGVPIYPDVRELLRDEEIVSDAESDGDSKQQEPYSRANTTGEMRPRRIDKFCGVGGATRSERHPLLSADVIVGGYPCQPFSQAGKRMGEEDDRHLWPEMYRIIKAVKPRWVIAENVAGHVTMGLDSVLSDLESEDYTFWTFIIPACAKNALHRRDRVWIVAQSEQPPEESENVADASNQRLQGGKVAGSDGSDRQESGNEQPGGCDKRGGIGWQSTPRLGGEPHGLPSWLDERGHPKVGKSIPRRVARLKQLGNAVVPQVVEEIGRAILEAENERP